MHGIAGMFNKEDIFDEQRIDRGTEDRHNKEMEENAEERIAQKEYLESFQKRIQEVNNGLITSNRKTTVALQKLKDQEGQNDVWVKTKMKKANGITGESSKIKWRNDTGVT